MNVAGLDLSLTGTGLALPDGAVRTLSSKQRGVARLIDLRDQIRSALWGSAVSLDWRPELVVIEDYAFSRAAAHAHELGELGGVVRVALEESHTPWVGVVPSALKKFATDKGNANKTEMAIAAVKATGDEFADDNGCDAFWLRQMGLYRFGYSDLKETAYRDEAVGKVGWPALATGMVA